MLTISHPNQRMAYSEDSFAVLKCIQKNKGAKLSELEKIFFKGKFQSQVNRRWFSKLIENLKYFDLIELMPSHNLYILTSMGVDYIGHCEHVYKLEEDLLATWEARTNSVQKAS